MSEPRVNPPFVYASDIEALRVALERGEWRRARDIEAEYSALDERKVRRIAQENREEFLTGNLGYKLVSRATPQEIEASANRIESQAAKMKERADRLREIAHQKSQP